MSTKIKIIFLVFIVSCFCLTSCAKETITIEETERVDFYFLRLDEADCTIIQSRNQTYIIDTGESKDENLVLKRLEELGVSEIEALILTHPDKDHIGNAEAIIKNYIVKQIYQTYYDKGSKLQESLDNTIVSLESNNVVVSNLLNLGNDKVNITIYPPLSEADESNDSSLVILVEVGDQSFLIPGDIEKEGISEFLKYELSSIDVLKAPHHGRDNKLSTWFYETMDPKYIVVTASSLDNSILEIVSKKKLFYTTYNEIHFMTDGNQLIVE